MRPAAPKLLLTALALAALDAALGAYLLLGRDLGPSPAILGTFLLSLVTLGLLLQLLRRSARQERERNQSLRENLDEVVQALGEHHQILVSTFEGMTDGFVSLDRQWRYTYVNGKAAEILGKPAADLVGKRIWDLFPEGMGPFRQAYERAMAERVSLVLEEHYEPWGRWFENRVYPYSGGIAVFFQEITARKRAEALEEGQTRILRLVAQGAELPDILGALDAFIQEQSGRALCSVLLLDPAGERVASSTAPALPDAFHRALAGQPIGPAAGSCGTAMYHRMPVLVEDIQADPRWTDYRELASKHGLRACSSWPLFGADGQVLGSFAMYFKEAALPNELELRMVDLACGLAVLAIERSRASLALKAGEERYRTTLAGILEGCQLIGFDWRYLYLNDAAAVQNRRPNAELLGRTMMEAWPGIEASGVFALLRRCMEGRIALHEELEYFFPDGSSGWFDVRSQPVPEGVFVLSIDISERVAAEQALRSRESQLSLIYDNISDIVFVLAVTPEGGFRFDSVSRSFLEVTGLSAEQILGKGAEEIIPPPAHELVFGKYREAIRTGRPVQWEEVSEYPTGTKTGEVIVAPVFDAEGVCFQLIGTVHDITEHRRAAAEISALNAELELRVAQRTAQLQTANQELEAFSYSVSHDLRAPLRAVSGFAEIVAKRHRAGLNEEGRLYVDNIVEASHQMGQLIEDLLDYARLGRSRQPTLPMDLGEALEPVLATLAGKLQESGGEITVEKPLPRILAQRTLLRQVLMNLMDNALTYHRPGVPPLIRLEAVPEGERMVRVSVSDNGEGIAPEHQDKVFQVFQRLHDQSTHPGSGIGLAIVRKSVELMGGTLRLESEPGSGSTFSFTLPTE